MERSLSVLLPVHNHQAALADQVQRLLDILPDLAGQFELVIIDDGSTDATIEVADELAHRYPQVRVARHAVPLGRVASLRTGLAKSRGDVILLYDEGAGLSLKEVSPILTQAEPPRGQREPSTAGRPRRPNYMARLREFALGE